jgi:hypothetical protein
VERPLYPAACQLRSPGVARGAAEVCVCRTAATAERKFNRRGRGGIAEEGVARGAFHPRRQEGGQAWTTKVTEICTEARKKSTP